MSGIFKALEISSTGMSVQRQKMDTVSENIANVDTSRTAEGGAYQRRRISVSESAEKPSFRSAMSRANGKLARTHDRHIAGVSRGNSRSEIPRVEGEQIVDPASSYKVIYDPGHPDANEEGYVNMPDIEIINEMVDMISANRAYEANIAAVSTAKRMINEAMDI
ncbi:MAG: flagellar basal body rod protein FlgC [Candidatus Zixiibacteriota bacterium]